MRDDLDNVEEVDRLAAPLEVVHKFVGRVRLLEDKSIVQEITELVDDIQLRIVCNATAELSELSNFEDEVVLDLVELGSDEFEGAEVPLALVLFKVNDFFLEFVELLKNHLGFLHDGLLLVLAVLEVAERLLLEEPTNK